MNIFLQNVFPFLLQIYPTDQSASSYSSNPSTPVSSPPPLTGANGPWPPAQGPTPSSPHFIPDRSNLAMVSFRLVRTRLPFVSSTFSVQTAAHSNAPSVTYVDV